MLWLSRAAAQALFLGGAERVLDIPGGKAVFDITSRMLPLQLVGQVRQRLPGQRGLQRWRGSREGGAAPRSRMIGDEMLDDLLIRIEPVAGKVGVAQVPVQQEHQQHRVLGELAEMDGCSDLLDEPAALLAGETAEIISGWRLPIRRGEPDLSPYLCDLALLPGIKFGDLGDVPPAAAQFQAPHSVWPTGCQDLDVVCLYVDLQQVSRGARSVLGGPLIEAIHDQQEPVVGERLVHQWP